MEYPSLDKPKAGAFRFNTDSSQLEIYDGNQWTGVLSTSPEQQTGGARGLIFGGYDGSSNIKNIDYFNFTTTGNALDFGDMGDESSWMTACADRTRGLAVSAGNDSGASNIVEYVTITSTGNAADFGDLTTSKKYLSALASSTRAVRGGGYTPSPKAGVDTIDYATIQSAGNFIDFGNLTQGRLTHGNGVSSPTRGVWGGGAIYDGPNAVTQTTIDFITISSTGNAADFGDLTHNRKAVTGCANAVRGIWSGGYTPTYVNTMDYVTLATLGNAKDFGDSTWTGAYKSGASSPTRGTWSGGRTPGNRENRIDYHQIMTTGNAIDFGDLVSNHDGAGGCSNAHGGL